MSLTTSPTKRQQVINEITENIRRGILEPGTRLATVRDMSAHFDVSLSVIQNALRELTDNGFVECRGASGFYVRETPAESPANKKIHKNTRERIFLSALHHSDLVWRYPYGEYEKIREEQLEYLLKLAGKYKQFHFCVEQAEILRVYLRKHPEDLKRFKALLKEGRFEYFGGLSIPDLNLISGESIVRNLLLGREYYRETFGQEPEIACMTDAFGMCAQLPQILVRCGYRYLLPGRMPNKPQEIPSNGPFRWHGLDETAILTAHSTAEITHLGYECNVPVLREYESQLARGISSLKYLEGNALVHYMTEEGKIEEDLFWIIEAVNRTPGRLVEFGRNLDYFRLAAETPLPSYHGEFNPTFSGCYTTRISVKQKLRKAENLLLSAETADLFSNTENDWKPLWDKLISAQFHDAACGCHTDAANAEIMEKLTSVIEETEEKFTAPSAGRFSICNFNQLKGPHLICGDIAPQEVPVQEDGGKYYFVQELPSCGVRNFQGGRPQTATVRKCKAHFKTDFFEADFSTPSPAIRNLAGETVFREKGFGEILIRSDYGTMWTEKFTGKYHGSHFQRETVTEITEGPVFIKAVTEGEVLPEQPDAGNLGSHWPGFRSLTFRKEYLFPKHLDHFRMKVMLEWQGNNTKISIRFPLNLKPAEAMETYEVPFGSIVRKPYFEVRQENENSLKQLARNSDYDSARGDWPALNWVNYSDHRKGLTLANNGTPGHQLVNGDILVSLLRSGTNIKDGCMVPQEGSFENGRHEFEFAFRAHSPREMEKAVELGQMLNRPPRICRSLPESGSLLDWDASNIVLSSMRKTEEGFSVRLYESLGAETTIQLRKSNRIQHIFEAEMSGKIRSELPNLQITFHPFEIKTFYCQYHS